MQQMQRTSNSSSNHSADFLISGPNQDLAKRPKVAPESDDAEFQLYMLGNAIDAYVGKTTHARKAVSEKVLAELAKHHLRSSFPIATVRLHRRSLA
jgi:hypothetical protein